MGMQNACQIVRGTGGVFTLDISPSACGWAYGVLSEKLPICGYWAMPELGGEQATYVAFANELYDAIEANEPSRVVIENPLSPWAMFGSDGKGGKRQICQTDYIRQIYGLRGIVYEACGRTSTGISGFSADKVRYELLGRNKWPGGTDAAKRAVLAHVRKLGLVTTSHDAADAVMIWLYVQRQARGIPDLGGSTAFRDAAD